MYEVQVGCEQDHVKRPVAERTLVVLRLKHEKCFLIISIIITGEWNYIVLV